MQILTTQALRAQTHCLIYGPAKSGKTRLALTAPNPIICDMDKGLSSIREANLPYIACPTFTAYMAFHRWVCTSPEAKPFQTIIIDDLTELAELFLVDEKPKHKNLMQAYGALNDTMMLLIRELRALPDRNVVLLCKQEKIKDESTGALIYGPKIPGQAVGPMLPYLMGEVYHIEKWTDPNTKQTHDVLRTQRDNSVDAGSRSGKLGVFEFANLTNIFAKVMS
jgi:hypothetical protein